MKNIHTFSYMLVICISLFAEQMLSAAEIPYRIMITNTLQKPLTISLYGTVWANSFVLPSNKEHTLIVPVDTETLELKYEEISSWDYLHLYRTIYLINEICPIQDAVEVRSDDKSCLTFFVNDEELQPLNHLAGKYEFTSF